MSAVADPVLAVLVDELLARGAKLAEWTDEEAERCRLVAFDVAQRSGPLHDSGKLWPHAVGLARNWIREFDSAPSYVERFVSVYDEPDWALTAVDVAIVERAWRRKVGSTRRLPARDRCAMCGGNRESCGHFVGAGAL